MRAFPFRWVPASGERSPGQGDPAWPGGSGGARGRARPAASLALAEGAAFWKLFLPPLEAQRDFSR